MIKKRNGGKWSALLCLLLCFLCLLSLPVGAAPRQTKREALFVGGMPFGVRYLTEGILVVGYCDITHGNHTKNPAKEAGVRPGDSIISVNGKAPDGVGDLAAMIEKNGGGAMELTICREGETLTVSVTPLACDSDGRYRTGLWVRDSGAGIGTVTYIKEDNSFGGLGHGICDGECGALVPLARGTVLGVTIGGIARGMAGSPGELKGHFTAGKTGSLCQNTPCGVFGTLLEKPAPTAGILPIGYRDELHDGAATCWCTLDDNAPHEYHVTISDIHRDAQDNKCFTVTVTDKTLLEKTGGIVQGMSGSPIIQDGKIVGAITHVLIGDPTTGYGIFIENMLSNMAQALS